MKTSIQPSLNPQPAPTVAQGCTHNHKSQLYTVPHTRTPLLALVYPPRNYLPFPLSLPPHSTSDTKRPNSNQTQLKTKNGNPKSGQHPLLLHPKWNPRSTPGRQWAIRPSQRIPGCDSSQYCRYLRARRPARRPHNYYPHHCHRSTACHHCCTATPSAAAATASMRHLVLAEGWELRFEA